MSAVRRNPKRREERSDKFEVRSGSEWDFFLSGEQAPGAASVSPGHARQVTQAEPEPEQDPSPSTAMIIAQLTKRIERLEATVVRIELQASQPRRAVAESGQEAEGRYQDGADESTRASKRKWIPGSRRGF